MFPTTFVLVILSYLGGVAAQEFGTESACNNAAAQVSKAKIDGVRGNPTAFCVPKY